MKEIKLQVLRAKIRGLQAEGESIRRRINKSSGPKRAQLWEEKRQLGRYARDHLIAYGLLRKVAYESIEHCKPTNRPDPIRIHELMVAHLPVWEAWQLKLPSVEALLEPTEKRLEK